MYSYRVCIILLILVDYLVRLETRRYLQPQAVKASFLLEAPQSRLGLSAIYTDANHYMGLQSSWGVILSQLLELNVLSVIIIPTFRRVAHDSIVWLASFSPSPETCNKRV